MGCISEGLHGVERDLSGLGGEHVRSSGGNDESPHVNTELELVQL